jgi:hypothetical protein
VWPFAERYKGTLSGNQNRHIGKIICEMRTGIARGNDKLCGKHCRTPGCIRHVRWFPRDDEIPRDKAVRKLRAEGCSVYLCCEPPVRVRSVRHKRPTIGPGDAALWALWLAAA